MRFSGFHIILVILILLHAGCVCCDFDVTLIGFSTKGYECVGHPQAVAASIRSSLESPSLTWHRTARIGEYSFGGNLGRLKSAGSIDRVPCVGRSQAAGTNPAIDALIKSVITNNSITSLANNRSRLICIGVSRLYAPTVTWKSSSIPEQELRVKTVTEPSLSSSRLTCDNVYKIISVLQIDQPGKMYECVLNGTETCSIHRQCKRKALLDGRVSSAAIGEGVDYENSSLKCSVLTSGLCSNISTNEIRLNAHQFGTWDIARAIRSAVNSLDDLERLCYFVYPACINESDPSAGFVPLCREDCFVLQFRYSTIWTVLTRYVANFFKSRKWNGCDDLPSVVSGPARCRQPRRKGWNSGKLSTSCYESYDRHYVGFANRTSGGHVCQRWDSLCPHYHEHWPQMYPELVQAENYCRNPGGLRQRPWCYTVERNVRVAHCGDIPLCAKFYSSTEGPRKQSSGVLQIFSIISGVVLFLASIVVYICRKREDLAKLCIRSPNAMANARYRRSSDLIGLTEDAINIDRPRSLCHDHVSVLNLPTNELYFRNERGIDRRLEALEVPRSSWSVIRKLASSEYSDIFLAQLESDSLANSFRSISRTIVAKTLKEPRLPWKVENFVQEACIAASCNHSRVVRFLGVCFVTQPSFILFEYIPLGDLKSILEAEMAPERDESLAEHFECLHQRWNPPLRHPKRLIEICYQIADAMVYLSNQRIIHRDLAARNALVDERLEVKISDFGMAKRVDKIGGTHVASDWESLPVRWTAPEAWSERQFSSKSDVWSYGVLVWEVLSFGRQPYIGMSHQEVVHTVVVMKKCLEASEQPVEGREEHKVDRKEIGEELMKPCFAYEPENRPDFINLLSKGAQLRAMFEL